MLKRVRDVLHRYLPGLIASLIFIVIPFYLLISAISPAPLMEFRDGNTIRYLAESATDTAAYRLTCLASDKTDESGTARGSIETAGAPKDQAELLERFEKAVAECRKALERGK